MGTKVEISPVGNPENSSFVTKLNDAVERLSDEFDKVVYRDGSLGVEDDVDMGANRLYNLPAPVTDTEPLRLADFPASFVGPPGPDTAEALAAFAGPEGSAEIGHTALWDGAITRTVLDKLRDLPHIYDIIPAANRTLAHDAAPELIQALGSGERFVLPKKEVRFSGSLPLTVNDGGFVGQGKGSRLVTTSATGDIFTVGSGVSETSGLRFEDFTIFSTVTRTSGWAFNCVQLTDAEFINLRIGSRDDDSTSGNRMFGGIYLDRFSDVDVVGGEIVGQDTLIQLRGNADQSFGAECSLGMGLLLYKGSSGVRLAGGAGGVYLGRVDISNCGTGVLCDNSAQAGTINRELFLSSECTIDNNTVWGLNIQENGLAFLDAKSWISGNGDVVGSTGGVRIATASNLNAIWTGVRLKNNKGDGFQCSSGTHVWAGGCVSNNGTEGPGANGMNLAAFATFTMTGANVDNNGNASSGAGIRIGGGQNNYLFENNNFFTNGVGGTRHFDDVSGVNDTTHVIRNNTGHVTENSGVATIAAGQTSVTVNHGLSGTPSAVHLSFAGEQDGGAYAYSTPGERSSTSFVLRYSVAASLPRQIQWRATKGAA